MQTWKQFNHINANSITEAETALAEKGAWVIAGGTDILGMMRFDILPHDMYPAVLVNLKDITPSLDYIKEENGMLKIGALAKLEDIAHNTMINEKYKALAQAAHRTASPHIREMGTIGGNICQVNRCWYFQSHENRFHCLRKGGNMCWALPGDNRYHSIYGAMDGCIAVNPSDTAPALIALNAKILTNKRTIDAVDFWVVKIPGSTILEKGEFVTEIQVPPLAVGAKSAFTKLALRKSIDFALVNCAAVIGSNNYRICLNAVAPIPKRVTASEDSIKDKTIDESSAEAAAIAGINDVMPMAAAGYNPGNRWKVSAAKGVLKQTILACK
jgi:xanthine dehydrogenase YagS FAD-binding subunit